MFLIQAPIAEWLLGDFDRNRVVNSQDLTAMLGALTNLPGYESTGGLTNADLLAIGDLNADGKVTNADLQGLISLLNGGGGTAAQAVPEPNAMWLGMSAAAALLICRRRGLPPLRPAMPSPALH
jgi:hypothetical protein